MKSRPWKRCPAWTVPFWTPGIPQASTHARPGAPGAAAADCGSALNSSTSALSCVDGAALGGKSTRGSTGAPLSSGAACDATAESTVNSSSRRLMSSSRILSR